MATTRIIAMHRTKGKSVAQCIKDRTGYAFNPDKTNDGELVTCYECDIKSVDAEFALSKREYQQITGRVQQSDVIAYQIRQSFKPGEISADDANHIGYKLAMRFLKGHHAFFVATHVDKAHIHNHIIWNSTSLDCTYKFRDFLASGRAVARLSDLICTEHQLSVVDNPQESGMKYNKWLGNRAVPSHRDELRAIINEALSHQIKDIDGMLDFLCVAGWEVKRGKDISCRGSGHKRFIRLHTLGDGYDVDGLSRLLKGKHRPASSSRKTENIRSERMQLLIDIQAKLSQGKSKGFGRWSKISNLKQMAKALNYLTEHGLTDYDKLREQAKEVTEHYHTLSAGLKELEARLADIGILKTHVINYVKTRDIYVAYRKAGYSKRFAAEHQQEIALHKAAKQAFDALGTKRIPTVRSLQDEYAVLLQKKKDAYAAYRSVRDRMRTINTVKANIDTILHSEGQVSATQRGRSER
ncbi:MAG: relaxase/mobilization nuclease domain-containing protein [Clostridiales bacterium]|nr:relaxase/mobilization nuclease domain-containing protein [Clostridiales bacterium]